jgi:hypothetical protein
MADFSQSMFRHRGAAISPRRQTTHRGKQGRDEHPVATDAVKQDHGPPNVLDLHWAFLEFRSIHAIGGIAHNLVPLDRQLERLFKHSVHVHDRLRRQRPLGSGAFLQGGGVGRRNVFWFQLAQLNDADQRNEFLRTNSA